MISFFKLFLHPAHLQFEYLHNTHSKLMLQHLQNLILEFHIVFSTFDGLKRLKYRVQSRLLKNKASKIHSRLHHCHHSDMVNKMFQNNLNWVFKKSYSKMAWNCILIRWHEHMGLKESISACDTISNSSTSKICEFKKKTYSFHCLYNSQKGHFQNHDLKSS